MTERIVDAEVRFPAPARLLNLNDRMHWSPKSRLTKAWREAAWVAAKLAAVGPQPPSVVSVDLPVRDRRKRDPHNYAPTLKAIIDGLVDAGLWVDDNSDWVATTEPRLVPGATEVVVRIAPR